MVLPKLFETDGAANFTSNVVDIKGALKPTRLDGMAEMKLPRLVKANI